MFLQEHRNVSLKTPKCFSETLYIIAGKDLFDCENNRPPFPISPHPYKLPVTGKGKILKIR
jgi:hypothetical protein